MKSAATNLPLAHSNTAKRNTPTTPCNCSKAIKYICSQTAMQINLAGREARNLKKRFRQLLLSIAELPMQKQRTELHKLVQWKGTEEQVDDILVPGIRI